MAGIKACRPAALGAKTPLKVDLSFFVLYYLHDMASWSI
jgi:hypothetical protein